MSSRNNGFIRNSSVADGSIPAEFDLFYRDHATMNAFVADDGGIYLLATDRIGLVIDMVFVHQLPLVREQTLFLLQ